MVIKLITIVNNNHSCNNNINNNMKAITFIPAGGSGNYFANVCCSTVKRDKTKNEYIIALKQTMFFFSYVPVNFLTLNVLILRTLSF